MREYSRQQLWDLSEEYASNVYRILGYGEPFQNAAFVLSHDMLTRAKGGFVGWTGRGVFENPFDSVAFSLAPFEYSKPYKDEHGWHIIYSEGYVAEGTAPLDTASVFATARQSLTGGKYGHRRREIMDSLRAIMEVDINPAVLDTNVYRLDDSTWAGVVGGVDTISSRELKMFEEGFRKKHAVDSTTSEIRREMIHAAADRYLIIQAARSHGLDTLPEAVATRERIWHSKCKTLVLTQRFDSEWEPTESMMSQYYDDHVEEFQSAKPLTVEHLEVKDSTLADFLAEQVRAGVGLPELKREYGDNQGYDVKYAKPGQIGAGDVEAEYYVVAIRATPQVGAVVAKTPSAYYVIRVLENRRPIMLPMAKGDIRTRMKKDHRRAQYEQFRDSLFQRYDVTFPSKLKAAEVPMLAEGRLIPASN